MRKTSTVNRLHTLLVITALLITADLAIPRQAACIYGASARATAGAVTQTSGGYGTFGPAVADARERTPENIPSILIRAGWAHGEASLSKGIISGFAFAESHSTDTYSQYTYVTTFIHDTLEFHIPAGDYPEGLEVTLYGRLKGLLKSNSWSDEPLWNFTLPDAHIFYKSYIGSPSQIAKGIFEFDFWNTVYRNVDESFTVTLTLVEPDEPVPNDRTVSDVVVSQTMTLQASSRIAFNPSWVDADFAKTARWLRLEVPEGVSWSSESGVLFNQSPMAGDYFDDGDVDGSDLAEFVHLYTTETYPEADLTEDGVINLEDVAEFSANFGSQI